MILKELIKTGLVTINYHKDGVLHKCKGYIHSLNLAEQTVFFKDQHENVFPIRISKIEKVI